MRIILFALGATCLALALSPATASAQCRGFGTLRIETGGSLYFRVVRCDMHGQPVDGCGTDSQRGPWYSYFPQDAHSQIQSAGAYPHWPAQWPPPPTPVPPPARPPARQTAEPPLSSLPASYYRMAPSYWYGQ